MKNFLKKVAKALKWLGKNAFGLALQIFAAKNIMFVIWRAVNALVFWRFLYTLLIDALRIPWTAFFSTNTDEGVINLLNAGWIALSAIIAMNFVIGDRDPCKDGTHVYLKTTAIVLMSSALARAICLMQTMPFVGATIAMLSACIEAALTKDLKLFHFDEMKKK